MTVEFEIWIARHGETEWSKASRHTGRTDIPLTDAGRQQAEALGRFLAGNKFDRVLCSPLLRARETCELALPGVEPELEPKLVERDYGRAEGLTTAELRKSTPGWTSWTHNEDGESLQQLSSRADAVIESIVSSASEGSKVLVVSHGHYSRAFAARWIQEPAEFGRRLLLGTAKAGVLGFERKATVVKAWNVS